MKRLKRTIAIALAALLMIGTLAACSPSEAKIHNPEDVVIHDADVDIIDFAWEVIPLTATPAMFNFPTPTAPRTTIKANQKCEIDYSNITDGYVMIKYLVNTDKLLKVRITGPNSVNYDYNLNRNGNYDVFPLSAGNGNYTISVFEQIEGSRYSTVNTVTVNVTLKDEFAPFLRPNQYVNFNANSTVVAKANELVQGVNNVPGKISAVFNFVISNITYDRDFAAEVQRGMHKGYVPNVDSVLAKGKGICFDFAALMTAMLRSQEIPTRLIIGYAGTAYHAWLDIWFDGGWITEVIIFDGRAWHLMDPTWSSSARTPAQAAELARIIGEGTDYQARYLY